MSALTKARKKAGITQGQLADKVGITQAAIGHYETGRRTPGLAMCRLIVKALNSSGYKCALEEVFPSDAAPVVTVAERSRISERRLAERRAAERRQAERRA